MRDNRLAWPHRAAFLGVVTREGDDEIEWHIFELIPRFAVGVRCVDLEIFAKNFQCEPMRRGFRTRFQRCRIQTERGRFFSTGIPQKYSVRSCRCAEEHDCETRFIGIHRV